MPDLELLTTAYEGGQSFGRIVRWAVLVVETATRCAAVDAPAS